MDVKRIVNRLVTVRSRIAELQCEAGALTEELKNHGLGTYEGSEFYATVYDSSAQVTDWKAVAKHLNPTHQLLTAHTRERHSTSLKLTARE